MIDEIEEAVVAGAIAALRRRAARQRQHAADGTVQGARRVIVRTGEAAVALRIAEALEAAAVELAGAARD
jgi:hypothetical protein